MNIDAAQSRLIDVALDETIGRSTPDVEHERAVAIYDLIEEKLVSARRRHNRWALQAETFTGRITAGVFRDPRRRFASDHAYSVADAFPAHRQRLFHDL
jgi:uncharacterized protein (UPF0262 family)